MNFRDRVTLMVCTAASGVKFPLFMVGKSKNSKTSENFKQMCPYGKPPMPYTNQSNAWFDKEVTIHWINKVLWPWHMKHYDEVNCILLLDNCKVHVDLDKSRLPIKLIIEFFPPNGTSFLQPTEMGIISSLKVGYKATMLKKLLSICASEELYEEAMKEGKKAKRDCKGLEYCGKAH